MERGAAQAQAYHSELDKRTKNGNMRDPYPSPYTFRFRKDFAHGEVRTIYFVNPAARCRSGTNYYGTIKITGNDVADPF